MFLENNLVGGSIELISGCMFSGKTEELIRRLNRAKIANLKTIIFKPEIDNRYHVNNVVSHNKTSIESLAISSSLDMIQLSESYQVIGIDEAQFFDDQLATVCTELANRKKRIIIAGLDMDFSGKPFGPMPELLAIAEFVTKVHAICQQCGNLASYSYRKSNSNATVQIGELESYEARCRLCFNTGMNDKDRQIELF